MTKKNKNMKKMKKNKVMGRKEVASQTEVELNGAVMEDMSSTECFCSCLIEK